MSLAFDASSFLGGMTEILQKMPEIQEKVIIGTLVQLGVYAHTVKPTVPKKEGPLRGSMVIEMEKEGVGKIEFQEPYAHRMDNPDIFPITNWSEPGSGKGYLSGKMKTFKDEFGKTAAAIASREIGNAT